MRSIARRKQQWRILTNVPRKQGKIAQNSMVTLELQQEIRKGRQKRHRKLLMSKTWVPGTLLGFGRPFGILSNGFRVDVSRQEAYFRHFNDFQLGTTYKHLNKNSLFGNVRTVTRLAASRSVGGIVITSCPKDQLVTRFLCLGISRGA